MRGPVSMLPAEQAVPRGNAQRFERGRMSQQRRKIPEAGRSRDLVARNFTASRPNQLWVSDFTYVATWKGFVYVAFVIDVFSRRIVGKNVTIDLWPEAISSVPKWTPSHFLRGG